MTDKSYLDSQYFIDESIYNCPFCNRRHVAYSVYDFFSFDWSNNKRCHGCIVECHSCEKRSMHLTFTQVGYRRSETRRQRQHFALDIPSGVDPSTHLNNLFFYSVPTSFFVLDSRVPHILRTLLVEAEGCLKSNFLTGASACARKIIYELGVLSKAEGDNYEDRIKSLKTIFKDVEPTFFDTLLTIQQVTSTKVHENSYDGWEAKHLRIILASLSEVLHEIYVVPALREDRRKAIISLKSDLIPSKAQD